MYFKKRTFKGYKKFAFVNEAVIDHDGECALTFL